ncbi:hypothetical protein IMSAG049_00238 [Clostridiales bacterium]|nr:hypothetical protein IMSAG049_00238 [Clostridiales bacterium]
MKSFSKERSAWKMFSDYPDVVTPEQLQKMLGGIGKSTAYKLLRAGEIEAVKIGRKYLIPKICVVEYLCGGGK